MVRKRIRPEAVHPAEYWAALFQTEPEKIRSYCRAHELEPESIPQRQAYIMLDYMLSHVKEYFTT